MTKQNPGQTSTKKREWLSLLFITLVFFPVLSIVCVGGYGFAVWMLQLIFGPPGHG
ncbi:MULTISPECIES: periplasmic nitrate reductase, NapE protein [Oceanimonas]|uniref:Periplasmic nitrate reductase, NapE protein n=1 Tax=Oceanimonas smirnovii TaxID=264574 RepID=A0ABW7NZ94_9GAMM|nr:periplasmic nitrate reductase, NapE protein [Oceanimonas sp. CAM02]MDV2857415.1 periplasmic nitrate reductase, NapE protein [Oceanimonas sp. CAM02]